MKPTGDMLNLRKLKQDFSSSILEEGKGIFSSNKVISAKILFMDTRILRITAKVLGQYNNTYESEIEIDRIECETIDSDCDCPYHYAVSYTHLTLPTSDLV